MAEQKLDRATDSVLEKWTSAWRVSLQYCTQLLREAAPEAPSHDKSAILSQWADLCPWKFSGGLSNHWPHRYIPRESGSPHCVLQWLRSQERQEITLASVLPEWGMTRELKWNPCAAFLEQKSCLWGDTVEFIRRQQSARSPGCRWLENFPLVRGAFWSLLRQLGQVSVLFFVSFTWDVAAFR